MQYTTSATFTDQQLDDDALTTIVARSVLEAALAEDEKAQLWFELGRDDDDETARLAIDLSASDLEEILRLSPEDEIALSLDGEAIESVFSDPDVEAHGIKGAIAIAVTSAAILAPASQAASPQSIGAAATTQRAHAAATTQRAHTAATEQRAHAAATEQVASVQAKLAKSNAAKLRAFTLRSSGLAR